MPEKFYNMQQLELMEGRRDDWLYILKLSKKVRTIPVNNSHWVIGLECGHGWHRNKKQLIEPYEPVFCGLCGGETRIRLYEVGQTE